MFFDLTGALGDAVDSRFTEARVWSRAGSDTERGGAREKGARGERESRGGVGPALIHARGTLGLAETYRRRPAAMASVATERGEEDDRGDFAPSPLAFSFSFLPALFSFILFIIYITDLN